MGIIYGCLFIFEILIHWFDCTKTILWFKQYLYYRKNVLRLLFVLPLFINIQIMVNWFVVLETALISK